LFSAPQAKQKPAYLILNGDFNYEWTTFVDIKNFGNIEANYLNEKSINQAYFDKFCRKERRRRKFC